MSIPSFLMLRLARLAARPLLARVRRFQESCADPEAVQSKLLADILARQAGTGFGKDHGFASIRTVADFRRQVPIRDYERLSPYIERVKAGETSALLADDRVRLFALTSGTTAARKFIPITDRYLRDLKRAWTMWGVRAYRDHRPRYLPLRPIVQMVGDPDEFRTSAGIPCGNLSGFTAGIQRRIVRRQYVVPALVGKIKDATARYYVALRFSLGKPVALFLSANPSTLVNLARTLNDYSDQLLRDLHNGTLDPHLDITPNVRAQLTAKLHRDGQVVGNDGKWSIDGAVLSTYGDLLDLLTSRLNDEHTASDWAGPAVGQGTINAFVRRLLSSKRHLETLIRADVPLRNNHRVSTSDAKVTVVDLHNLHDRAKRFVVGTTIRRVFEDKEQSGSARPLLFLVLDELNKYAPREGSSPIKEILVDVAERGRSLGVILVGAQQTASEVERRIIANSSIRVVGRLDPAEASRPEYGFLPNAMKQRATIAKPGTMFLNQPELPIPLVLEFPFPAWATRPSEAGPAATPLAGPAASRAAAEPDDPFDGL